MLLLWLFLAKSSAQMRSTLLPLLLEPVPVPHLSLPWALMASQRQQH